MDSKYVFHSSCFDKELFRKSLIILNENSIDYKIIEKSTKTQFRAPLSGHFEIEIHINKNDFEKASELLNEIIE
jgi:hypothetical protein